MSPYDTTRVMLMFCVNYRNPGLLAKALCHRSPSTRAHRASDLLAQWPAEENRVSRGRPWAIDMVEAYRDAGSRSQHRPA